MQADTTQRDQPDTPATTSVTLNARVFKGGF